jgi:lysozyme family protein
MTDNFDTFIRRILDHEGGYTNNPKDPGNWTGGKVGQGRLLGTKFGIAANTYPNVDIPGLTIEKASAIYRRDYWIASGADRMPPAVGFQLLDGAINSGVKRSVQWLQQAVGVTADGVVGPRTIAAVGAMDPADVVLMMLAARLAFMADLTSWADFGRGWARRIAQNMRYGAGDSA